MAFRTLVLPLALLLPGAALAAPTCEERGTDYEARIRLCDQAYAEAADPDVAASALGYKAEAQRMLGRLDEAAATLHGALRLAPQGAWYWVELGLVRADAGDPAGAVAHYSTAIELAPTDSYARLSRADAWWQLNAPDRCLADSGPAIEAAPEDAWGNLVHGRCLTGLGRAEEGLIHLDRALAADPDWSAVRVARTAALLALGRTEEALTAAEEGLNALPPDDGAREDLLMLHLQAMARSRPAEEVLAEAAGLAADYPGNLTIATLRVWTLTRAGQFEEAGREAAPLRDAETAGTVLPGLSQDALGQLALAQSDLAAASRRFGLAMALDPGLARAYTRALSEQGFLPLTAARHNVTLALQRCLQAKGAGCKVGG